MTYLKTTGLALTFAFFTLVSTGVFAQQQEQQNNPAAGMQQPAQQEFSNGELELFVKSSQEIEKIRIEYTKKLDATKDQEKAQQLQMEAKLK